MNLDVVYSKNELKTAEKRCQSVLKKCAMIQDVSPTCQITVLIPVYDESIERMKKQLGSFAKQKMNKDLFELVFVINNPPPDGSTEREKAIKQNAKVMTFLKKRHPLTVHVIDLSSEGKALPLSNVGLARNIGLHIVAQRYLKQRRDGIIIHTDADTLPHGARYLHDVYRDLNSPLVFGAAGGVEFIMDIDSFSQTERRFFKKHIQTFRDYTEWHILVNALQKKRLPKIVASPTRFFGAHMITKAIAGVLAGGIPENGRGEDTAFGLRLEMFAKDHGGQVLARWDHWTMQTAFRESRRTGASFGPVFDNIRKHHGKPLVRAKDAPHYFHEYLPKLLLKVAKTKGDELALAKLFGPVFTEANNGAQKAINHLAKDLPSNSSIMQRQEIYGIMKDHHVKDRPDLVFYAKYKADHPLVHLTPSALAGLRREVYKDPKKKAFAESAVLAFGQWKLASESRPKSR